MPLVAPKEIMFNAYEDEDGGYYAAAEGHGMVTQGDDWEELKAMVWDIILCHFDEGVPETVRIQLIIEREAMQEVPVA